MPYCGLPPDPATLLERWNLDPILLVALCVLAGLHLFLVPKYRAQAAAGWITAALALVSPLCALSVALFSARVAQHLALAFVAAPLIAAALPRFRPDAVWTATAALAVIMWSWHMPVPYALTLQSTRLYWFMHLTIFGSALFLWTTLLRSGDGGFHRLAAGALTSLQMGLLGALLTLASHVWFAWHIVTTQAWGLSPLADQHLGGLLMWIPGGALFVWVALREVHALTRNGPMVSAA